MFAAEKQIPELTEMLAQVSTELCCNGYATTFISTVDVTYLLN